VPPTDALNPPSEVAPNRIDLNDANAEFEDPRLLEQFVVESSKWHPDPGVMGISKWSPDPGEMGTTKWPPDPGVVESFKWPPDPGVVESPK
jgi:hypothetical protein